MKFTTKYLMQIIKAEIERLTNEKVDFRKHAFLENHHGAVPCFNYHFAECAVHSVYTKLENILNENPESFDFNGWEWNKSMEIEKLRTTSLKTFIECRIEDLLIHQVNP